MKRWPRVGRADCDAADARTARPRRRAGTDRLQRPHPAERRRRPSASTSARASAQDRCGTSSAHELVSGRPALAITANRTRAFLSSRSSSCSRDRRARAGSRSSACSGASTRGPLRSTIAVGLLPRQARHARRVSRRGVAIGSDRSLERADAGLGSAASPSRPRQVLARPLLHPRRDFLREQLEQQLGHRLRPRPRGRGLRARPRRRPWPGRGRGRYRPGAR